MARRKVRDERYKTTLKTDLDIVIPVYGNPQGLRACLAGIETAGLLYDYRVYIVDDQSPEDDKAEIEAIYATLPGKTHKLIRNSRNMGFPFTVNRGASEGFSPIILFLNSDVVLEAGAISAMMKVFNMPPSELPHNPGQMDEALENAGAGAVSPKLIFSDDSPHGTPGHIQHAGMYFRLDGTPQHAFMNWGADNPRVNVMRSLQIATGACLAVRREVFNLIVENYRQLGETNLNGAFNLNYGRGTFEDMEFCLSVRGVGWKVIYQPEAVASHFVGQSSAAKGIGFDLARNLQIFQIRAGHLLKYDHYLFSRWEGAES